MTINWNGTDYTVKDQRTGTEMHSGNMQSCLRYVGLICVRVYDAWGMQYSTLGVNGA